MSWSASIGQTAEGVPADEIANAIESVQPSPSELSDGPRAQFEHAKVIASAIITDSLADKRAYRVSMSGHADPGDGSTPPDELAVRVAEVR